MNITAEMRDKALSMGRKAFDDGVSLDQVQINFMFVLLLSEQAVQEIRDAIAQGYMDAASERVKAVSA